MVVPQKLIQLGSYSKQLARHGFHLSKHAARVLAVSSVVAGLSFVVINAALLTMQITSEPLFLKVGNIDLSLKTPGEAQVLLSSYGQAQTLKLKVQDKTYKTAIQKAGIKLDTSAVLVSTQHPTGWNKIPLIYAINNMHRSFPLQYDVNDSALKGYLGSIGLPKQKSAVSATIVIPQNIGQAAYIAPASRGYVFSAEKLADQIAQTVSKDKKLDVTAQAQTLQPKISAAELSKQLSQINGLLDNELTITNGIKSYKLTAADLRQVVTVANNQQGIPQAGVSHDQMVELLRSHSNLFYIAPTDTKITTVDGQQVAKADGVNGQTVNIDVSANQIVKALQAGRTAQSLTMATVGPNTTYLKNYTATSAGLNALINDFAAGHSGSWDIATLELTGNRSAYYHQNDGIVPASMYKLYVAYVALKDIEQGSLSFSSATSLGSLDYCLQRMIHISDNNCAAAILDLLGWSQAESAIVAAGFTSTNVNNSGGGYMTTTAGDFAKLLQGLYTNTLLNSASTAYLFDLMEHQIYRTGIPAGSNGAIVADKVGYLYSWVHDGGIVYAPNSTYILVVMSVGGNYNEIADLASQVYNLYNQ